ncbi:MAG: hypothetical protein LC632_06040 [Xanthomonadaceae bacterium]|nr:hypothetical protein [Xanthomonadaceae bacterium]
MTASRLVAAALLCAFAPVAPADGGYPRVVEIRFADNLVTQPAVFLREMALGVGDPADPVLIERSRQAILDLELYRSVRIRQVPATDGVALVVEAREKRFLLAIPRIDSSSDGDFSYGLHVRWDNLWGANHTFDARILTGTYPDDRLREEEDSARIRYTAPYVWGNHGWHAEVEYIDRLAPVPGGVFDETIRRAEFLLSHDLRDSRPRSGWILKSGLRWDSQHAEGALAPQSDGHATALVLGADFANVRYHVYSESGRMLSSRIELAHQGFLSSYSYRKVDARFVERIPLARPHHTLNLISAAGLYSGVPRRVSEYSLGGSSMLRGYELDFIEGERYGYAAAEYLRPIFGRDWLRLLIVGEGGWTGGAITGVQSGGPYASIGAGVRIRVTYFMRLELEFGIAYPLRGGDGLQFFAGGG